MNGDDGIETRPCLIVGGDASQILLDELFRRHSPGRHGRLELANAFLADVELFDALRPHARIARAEFNQRGAGCVNELAPRWAVHWRSLRRRNKI